MGVTFCILERVVDEALSTEETVSSFVELKRRIFDFRLFGWKHIAWTTADPALEPNLLESSEITVVTFLAVVVLAVVQA